MASALVTSVNPTAETRVEALQASKEGPSQPPAENVEEQRAGVPPEEGLEAGELAPEEDDNNAVKRVGHNKNDKDKGYYAWRQTDIGGQAISGGRGKEGRKPGRHTPMDALAVREQQFVTVPRRLFMGVERRRGGLLTGGYWAFRYYPEDEEYFNGVFMLPMLAEAEVTAQEYVIETLRQRAEKIYLMSWVKGDRGRTDPLPD